MKQKVDDICLWFDLDDSDTQSLIKEATSSNTTAQEIVIPAFDIHNIEFDSGLVDDRTTTNVYELRMSPQHAAILKSIIWKVYHLGNHLIIQFISYGIQGITNKDIYRTIIKKINIFISDGSIIPVYDIEERDIKQIQKTNYEYQIYSKHWINSRIETKMIIFYGYDNDRLQESSNRS